MRNTALENALDQLDLGADGIVAVNLLLHGGRRAAAVQADDAVPPALVAGGQVFNEASCFDALLVGHIRVGAQHFGQLGAGLRVMVFIRPGQGDDQPAADVVGDAVHIVNFGGQQQLADVGKHRVGHEGLAVLVGFAVNAGGHTASEKALGDGDQLDHLLAQVAFFAGVKTIGLAHQRPRAYEQVPEAGACAYAGVAMVSGIAVSQVTGVFPIAGVKHALPRNEDLVKHHHARALAVFAAEKCRAMLDFFARPAGGSGDDGDALGVHRHGATDGKVGVLAAHVAAGHDQQLVHIGRAGDDGLGAGNHDAQAAVAPHIALDDVHIAVHIGLLVRSLAAVAFGVCHGNAQCEVLVLHPVQVVPEARAVLCAAFGVVYAGGHLADGVEGVVREVALRATGFLADQTHRFQLVEQVAAAGVDVGQTVDQFAAGVLHRRHDGRVAWLQSVVVSQRNGIDTGRKTWLVGYAGHSLSVQKNPGFVASKRLTEIVAGHQIGDRLGCIHGRLRDEFLKILNAVQLSVQVFNFVRWKSLSSLRLYFFHAS